MPENDNVVHEWLRGCATYTISAPLCLRPSVSQHAIFVEQKAQLWASAVDKRVQVYTESHESRYSM